MIKMEGLSSRSPEQVNILRKYMRDGGVGLDPAQDAWCAAFTNAALAHAGIKGSGSNMASSFKNWATGVKPGEAKKGDVVYTNQFHLGSGHVGIATGKIMPNGDIEVEGGNTGKSVKKFYVHPGNAWVRRAPEPENATAVTPEKIEEAKKHASSANDKEAPDPDPAPEKKPAAAEVKPEVKPEPVDTVHQSEVKSEVKPEVTPEVKPFDDRFSNMPPSGEASQSLKDYLDWREQKTQPEELPKINLPSLEPPLANHFDNDVVGRPKDSAPVKSHSTFRKGKTLSGSDGGGDDEGSGEEYDDGPSFRAYVGGDHAGHE